MFPDVTMLRAAQVAYKSDTGRERRANEDRVLARPPVFVVADGMGGAQAGEVASQMAVDAFEQGLPEAGSPEERLAVRIREANRQIYERAHADYGRAGMGTTLTAAYLDDTSVAVAHVGDSRAYLFRDGSLQRLTQDHSLIAELVRQGKLTEEEAVDHPQRSIITRALGPEDHVDVDTHTYPVRAGDVVLLCSDGLTSMISEERIGQALASSDTLDAAAEMLIRDANEAGGRDNITVVLFSLEEVGAGGAGDEATIIGVPPPSAAAATRSPDANSSHDGGPASGTTAVASPPRLPDGRSGNVRRPPRIVPPASGRHDRAWKSKSGSRRPPRYAKPVAALVATAIVVFLVGAGGYIASRQLYFIGTNAQGIVTVYRGLPYVLPAGINLFETYYVSGVPASLVPADRRSELFDNRLRSQSDATSLAMDLELGKVSR